MVKRVAVIGAGIAGATVAYQLAQLGCDVLVFEAHSIGYGGSGNPTAVLYPKLVPAAHTEAHVQSQGFLRALEWLQSPEFADCYTATGVLWLDELDRVAKMGHDHPWLGQDVFVLNAQAASERAGTPIQQSAFWLPRAGLIRTRRLLDRLLSHPQISLHTPVQIQAVTWHDSQWCLRDEQQSWSVDDVVLANAGAAEQLLPEIAGLMNPVRGQLSLLPANFSLPLSTTVCYGGYIGAEHEGFFSLGATFQRNDLGTDVRSQDHQQNWAELHQFLPELAARCQDIARFAGRASLRWQTKDYLPLCGAFRRHLSDTLRQFPPKKRRPELTLAPPIYLSVGHGAKGFSQAWVAADVITAQLMGRPLPYPAAIIAAIDAERFVWRAWQRGELWAPR